MEQMQAERSLRPTVEITKRSGARTTKWGWTCTCGDSIAPRLVKKDRVLAEAREHFDTKHGGAH